MKKIQLTFLSAAFGLAALAPSADAAGLFSATGDVIAILDGELYLGKAEGHLNGAGTLAIHAQKNPALICTGQFTSSAALGGTGNLVCSDGAVSAFQFQRLNAFRGHGVGTLSRGSMSFVYGLNVAEAASYLKLPEGKKLRQEGAELALVDL
jgi:hypothetical protein